MNLVDSSGWLEYFTEGANVSFFASQIETPETLLVPTICIYEVSKRLIRELGVRNADAAFAVMSEGCVIGLTPGLAMAAAEVSLATKLGMADSIILATARYFGATVWTQDSDFEGLEGVMYTPK